MRIRHLSAWAAVIALVLGVLAFGSATLASSNAAQRPFEIWALDQSDTSADGGGLLYIWDGVDLSKHASQADPLAVIDLATAAIDAGCAVARRPHMALPSPGDPSSHAVIANVGSGDIFFFDVVTRAITGCVSLVGGFGGAAGGSVAAHAAAPTPDGSMVIVDDIGGAHPSGYLHKIETDYSTNSYGLVETLPLAPYAGLVGTAAVRPICHDYTADGRFAYVTLAGGGLIVVEVGIADGAAPMSVAHVYPASVVPGIGCGAFRLPDGDMLTNGESGAGGGDDFLFRFNTSGAADGDFPPPAVVELPGEDTHGVAVCTNAQGDLFALTGMRVSNHIVSVNLATHRVEKVQSMARPWSPDPKPDVAALVGDRLFIALRGPKPLTAITALESATRTPGVAVLKVNPNCTTFNWSPKDLASMADPTRLTTLADGSTVTAADPHGLAVVLR